MSTSTHRPARLGPPRAVESQPEDDSPADTTGAGRRIAVLSASVGAGHDVAAGELARRLAAAGFTVDRHDFLDLLPARLGPRLRRLYQYELKVAPRSWGWICQMLERYRAVTAVVVLLATCLAGRRMRRVLHTGVAGTELAAVVSTYHIAGQVLARLKRRGRLTVPVTTYLTDVSVHPVWVGYGIDTYLAPHEVTAGQARRLGAGNVQVTAPAIAASFAGPALAPDERAAVRRRFGLPETERLALVVAGSWGVGDVEQTARDIRDTGLATPVVVCASNAALRESLTRQGIGVTLGWVDDMPALIRACDVVISNGCGITSVESLVAGVPMVVYRCLPGHGKTNAVAFDQAGLARWVRSRQELADTLRQLAEGGGMLSPRAALPVEPEPAALIAGTAEPGWLATVPRQPRPGRVRRRLIAATAAVVAGLWIGTAGATAAVAHGFRAARPTVSDRSRVFLVVELPDTAVADPAVLHRLANAHAAIAVDENMVRHHPGTVRAAARAGVPLVNAGPGRPYETGVVTKRTTLSHTALGIHRITGEFPDLMLSNGDLDVVDVVTASWYHERILVPANIRTSHSLPAQLVGGNVVLVSCADQSAPCRIDDLVQQFTSQARDQGLDPAPVTRLAA